MALGTWIRIPRVLLRTATCWARLPTATARVSWGGRSACATASRRRGGTRHGQGADCSGNTGGGAVQGGRAPARGSLPRYEGEPSEARGASPIKPWRHSSNEERLKGENGFLLTPSIDHLFDPGFVSFKNDGRLLICPRAHAESLARMGVPTREALYVGQFLENRGLSQFSSG